MNLSPKSIWLVVIVFCLIVGGMFWYAYLERSDATQPDVTETSPIMDMEEEIPYPQVTRIDAKHYFIDGVHTIVGEIPFPTPCDLLESTAVVRESFPEQIEIEFSVINNAEMCLQVITTQRFRVDVSASPEATFTATFMGRSVPLNLVPAGPDETPEDFELFIKG